MDVVIIRNSGLIRAVKEVSARSKKSTLGGFFYFQLLFKIVKLNHIRSCFHAKFNKIYSAYLFILTPIRMNVLRGPKLTKLCIEICSIKNGTLPSPRLLTNIFQKVFQIKSFICLYYIALFLLEYHNNKQNKF